jgi:hypothetical protein
MTGENWLDLQCHPSIRPGPVLAIQVSVLRSASGELQMTFRLDGDLPRIRIPSPAVPGIGAELWRHTCFEIFIALEGHRAYHEFNFAPSREWTLYSFSGYRDGGPVASETIQPQIAVRSTGNRLELDGTIRLDSLSAMHPRALLRIGLSAVIETGGGFSYWALRHPIEKPDFHNAEGFVLKLEPPVSDE